jgi:Protein of unknown function (DUF5131)
MKAKIAPLTKTERWHPSKTCSERVLYQPLHWLIARKIDVCPRDDLFNPNHDDRFLDQLFAIAALGWQHEYIIETAYFDRAKAYVFNDIETPERIWKELEGLMEHYPDQFCDWMFVNRPLMDRYHEVLEAGLDNTRVKPILGRKLLQWPIKTMTIIPVDAEEAVP